MFRVLDSPRLWRLPGRDSSAPVSGIFIVVKLCSYSKLFALQVRFVCQCVFACGQAPIAIYLSVQKRSFDIKHCAPRSFHDVGEMNTIKLVILKQCGLETSGKSLYS